MNDRYILNHISISMSKMHAPVINSVTCITLIVSHSIYNDMYIFFVWKVTLGSMFINKRQHCLQTCDNIACKRRVRKNHLRSHAKPIFSTIMPFTVTSEG